MDKNICLFEVSWEVCNKVGGINTVLRSKLKEATKYFKEHYILIGPLLSKNTNFIEKSTPLLKKAAKILEEHHITCRIGLWDTIEQPQVILVDFQKRYKIDELLYNLWNDFGVDSLASNFEYIEPILFATASGEVIKTLVENLCPPNKTVITHFHEWLCGAGVLFLKKEMPQIPTIFTTHATVLGRALSGAKRCIYSLPKTFDSTTAAKTYGVFAKHSLELAAAKNADCFTTVSSIMADETNKILGKYPDKIVFNGIDTEKLQHELSLKEIEAIRKKLITIAQNVIGQKIPDNALLWVTSGRFEFHNKGYDTLLTALSKLERQTTPPPPIIMFFLIAAKQYSKQSVLHFKNRYNLLSQQNHIVGITTHDIDNPDYDLIIRRCNELKLREPQGKIRIVYSNAYLDGEDGVFDLPYEHILAACDLSLFPSFYEPWGYTPLESITFGTPTITTNLSGFGNWVLKSKINHKEAVHILDVKCNDPEKISSELMDYLKAILEQNPKQREQIRKEARNLAKYADWELFFKDYLAAYHQAIEFNAIDTTQTPEQTVTRISVTETTKPTFHLLQHESILPEALKDIRQLAYNLWWTWNENTKSLFKEIDPTLWNKIKHNPIHFLNLVSNTLLGNLANDPAYMEKYSHTLASFNQYYQDTHRVTPCPTPFLSTEHPIVYFCMEFGLDRCLPIYSGGLGLLAGDYLKTLSDMNIPTIGISLFYREGYFHQAIGRNGEQIVAYDTANPNQIPMKTLNDAEGKPMLINIDILGRTIYSHVWEVKIGRVNLYLLDTDTPENTKEDRKITDKLYDSLQENRLTQEILLGMGGVKLITEKLAITPCLYHLNEGHTAFLLLERIKQYIHEGFSFQEAKERVRYSSVFTTHTPVPAGNETFPDYLIRKYFANYAERVNIPIETLLNLGRDDEKGQPVFSMTVLALRLTAASNAVSKRHGKIARSMWRKLWLSLLENEIPIQSITNGIHLTTWLSTPMKHLYNQYLDPTWKTHADDHQICIKIKDIPDDVLWHAHQQQKEKLLKLVKIRVTKEYSARNENKKLIRASLNALQNNALLIGLARRITGYKRNDLILKDQERLARLLTSEQRPIVLLIAGKTHPSDTEGQKKIQSIIQTLRDKSFRGHIIFLENYDMMLAKALTQGTDIWLNTPLLNHEASGTSGMKAGINGCLNLSIRDGWFDETNEAGFDIHSFENLSDSNKRDDMENMDLLNTLEDIILPLYFENRQNGFNPQWTQKMKSALISVSRHFNTCRMMKDYFTKLYCPLMAYSKTLTANHFEALKIISDWKQKIIPRFNTVKIKNILIAGLKDGKVTPKGKIKVKVVLFTGKLTEEELKVEFVLIKNDGHKMIEKPVIISLTPTDERKNNILTYTVDYTIKDTGFYAYAVRVYPHHPLLCHPLEAGIVYWG